MANALGRRLPLRWALPNRGQTTDGKNWIPPWVEATTTRATLESNDSGGGIKKGEVEKLWRGLFSDPSAWRDHRLDKTNSRYPDFKHKREKNKALWLDSEWVPRWVREELATLKPGTIESSVFSWNQRLARLARAGQYQNTIEVFQQMQRDGIAVDRFTFPPVLNACASLGLLEDGRRIHKKITEQGFDLDLFIGSSLVDMYAKCGSIDDAWKTFNGMPTRDVVAWTAMMAGFVKCGQGQDALDLFQQMQREGVDPNPITFMSVLNACSNARALEMGRLTHKEIIRRGFESIYFVRYSLVDMYAKCEAMREAEIVFYSMSRRDSVACNAMLLGYLNSGEGQLAVDLFRQMQHEGVEPNPVTFVRVLNACASVGALEVGRHAHEEILRRGYESDVFVGSSLIDMYSKCGSINDARRVFDTMPTKDVVSWNAMIMGYMKCGEAQQSLELFEQLHLEGLEPNPVTFVGVLKACGSAGALRQGRRAHEEIVCRGYESDLFVGSCLVEMYAKCGRMEDAEKVFNQMAVKDVVAWNSMLAGYSNHGYATEALETFAQMCEVSDVNGATFVSLLSACSHGGLVSEGLEYFKSMGAEYNITPRVEHYACAVHLLGRDGHLQEAEDLIRRMPLEPNATIWMSLLGACRIHGNLEVGERTAKRVLELDAEKGRAHLEEALGRTWIEDNNGVHSFVVNDVKHPKIVGIHAELKRLAQQLKDSGFVQDIRCVSDTLCVNKEENEFDLFRQSELLAIGFGHLSTAPGTPLLIVKNVRVCDVSHAAMKFIAKILGRAITVRDVQRFHHFQDGHCSCRDYW